MVEVKAPPTYNALLSLPPPEAPPRTTEGNPLAAFHAGASHQEELRYQQLQELILLVGHELRTPLTAILGLAELMVRRGNPDQKRLSSIIAQARQLDRLVGDLVDSATLQVGQLQVHRRLVDLRIVARAALERAQLTSQQHQLRLAGSREPLGAGTLQEVPLFGWWDPMRLTQIFGNLLSNAVKYSPAGGEVLVTLEDLGTEVRVSVEDRGIGIAPAALSRLFDRYYRVDGTPGAVPGLGIGLHVTNGLVEAHGGQLCVESLLGYGSVFSFTLPKAPSVPESEAVRLNELDRVAPPGLSSDTR